MAGKESARKQRLIFRLLQSIKLLRSTQGRKLERAAVRILLVLLLDAYVKALRNTPGSIELVKKGGEDVIKSVAASAHVAENTAKNALDAWIDMYGGDGGDPTEESISKLLDTICDEKPRGPTPLPFRTSRVTSHHVAQIRAFIRERLANGQMTYIRVVRSASGRNIRAPQLRISCCPLPPGNAGTGGCGRRFSRR